MTTTARQSAQEGPYRPAPPPSPSYGQLDAVGAAFWPITAELGYHGIFLTGAATRSRHTCPECGPTRRKSTERCLRVEITSPTTATVNCKHCPYCERITA